MYEHYGMSEAGLGYYWVITPVQSVRGVVYSDSSRQEGAVVPRLPWVGVGGVVLLGCPPEPLTSLPSLVLSTEGPQEGPLNPGGARDLGLV